MPTEKSLSVWRIRRLVRLWVALRRLGFWLPGSDFGEHRCARCRLVTMDLGDRLSYATTLLFQPSREFGALTQRCWVVHFPILIEIRFRPWQDQKEGIMLLVGRDQ